MRSKKRKRTAFLRRLTAGFVAGVLVMAAVFVISTQSDMAATQRVLETTAGYITEQCNRYARIELAAETKSLMRIIESCGQINHHLLNSGEDAASLQEYARDSYVSGVLLLDADGKITAQYHEEGTAPEVLNDALGSPAVRDLIDYPEKRYAVRLHSDDGSEVDVSASRRQDGKGIVAVYYHTPLEYIESFNLSIKSLLSGYKMENEGTIVVSNGDTIVASNDEALIGCSTSDVPILRQIKSLPETGKMTHTSQKEGSLTQYFGLMKHARDFYVYTYLPERGVFVTTPRTMLYTLIVYAVILAIISAVHWRTAQRYREQQLRAQKEYADSLQDKNEQLSVAVEQADRANAAKTSFLSRMSHDIRTPLNGIIGLLAIDAAHPEDTALVNANRDKMRIAADHLLSLINDVLQMSKLESGEIILAHEPVELRALSIEIMTIIDGRAAESGITMEYDRRSDHAPVPWVYGSPLHLRQIFLNIYTNCIKYNRIGGKITTLRQCVQQTDSTVTYRWTITDTGMGMSEEFLRHIFDPFTQERADARSVYQGTGLGMTIVKGLIEQMNGTIEISSKEGVGSTFVITLPFEIAEPPKAAEPAEIVSAQADICGLHLLLAEDNELNAEIAKTLLEDAGASVTVVSDGQQAVEQFEKAAPGTYDTILMDVMMPVMDGLTAAKAIRALDCADAQTIPIIAMTANAFAEDAEKCLDAGMDAHLAKPLEIDKVIATIAQHRYREKS